MATHQVNVRLSDEEIAVLEALGGKSKGIKFLIKEHIKRVEQRNQKKDIEEVFYTSIILPADSSLRETYMAFLNAFIRNNARKGSIDYYIPRLSGTTGFDEFTLRKHFRKLAAAGFVASNGLLFRPTIRLRDTVTEEEFKRIYRRYAQFLRGADQYRDIGTEIFK